MKRALTFISLLTAIFLAPFVSAQTRGNPALLGEIVFPTGLKISGVEFGGISGLDFDAENDVYYAISDDRSDKAPARFYTLKVAMGAEGIRGVDIVSMRLLLNAAGEPFATKDVDPESIRFNRTTSTFYWTSEGDLNGKPAVRESRLDGTLVREFILPNAYVPNAEKTLGIQDNLSFESMTISPDGKTLLVGTENALVQDGGKASLEAGSRSRIIVFDIASGKVITEYVYETDPIFTKATQEPYWNDNGLSEFVALGNDLFTVERSFALGVGSQISFYRASFEDATDVTGKVSIKAEQAVALKKELVLKLGEGDFGLDIDNIESVTWGPEVAGRKTMIVVSDNNFNPLQFTQFIALTFDSPED
ncbi:esterase-like activity of phytase family protein [Ensifer sp. YR511]|uniref:esterase-like activity of phytase family protein n=1 Tax=Ensifer sp. YR511 TaxID=1855294 RepID=UPI001FCE0F1E|nr:esterase-like activity of phytase family protein [Ensifer sp. YR511]